MSIYQVTDFIHKIGPLVKDEASCRGYSDAQIYTCIAQACLETGYGKSNLMMKANALFGIKATQGWIKTARYGGLVYKAKTNECYDGKSLTSINSTFRAYHCLEDCISDYFDLMEYKRYKDSLKASTVEDCITIIAKSGYATSPSYINNVINVYYTYKGLIDMYGRSTGEKGKMQIALEVIQGKWGNGSERKERLTAAGYDYRSIQNIVNELLE